MKKFFLLATLLIVLVSSNLYSQKGTTYEFDKVRPTLKKDQLQESSKIIAWFSKTNFIDERVVCTKPCEEYLSNIPDDIELGNEEKPGALKRAFKKQWASRHDINRIPGVHPFEIGNGGCSVSHATNIVYLGSINNAFYFNATFYCDSDKQNNNKLILKIINENGYYRIDDVMSQKKFDYFADQLP